MCKYRLKLHYRGFLPPESRSILLPVVLHHIHLHLRQQRELLICSGILSSIFSIIKTSSMVLLSVRCCDVKLCPLLLNPLLMLLSIIRVSRSLRCRKRWR